MDFRAGIARIIKVIQLTGRSRHECGLIGICPGPGSTNHKTIAIMSERIFRIVLGASLLLALSFKLPMAIYAFTALLLFEGITNWRIPILVSRLRFGKDYKEEPHAEAHNSRYQLEAERALRFIVALFVFVPYELYPELLWFLPWFVGIALLLAGLTNLCPMVVTLRWAGLR